MIALNATLAQTYLLCANGSDLEAPSPTMQLLSPCKSATPYAPFHITYVGYTVTVEANVWMNGEDTTLTLKIFPISPFTNCALPASVYLDKSMNAHVAVPVWRSNMIFGCITATYPSQNTGAALVDKKAFALANKVAVIRSEAEIDALAATVPG